MNFSGEVREILDILQSGVQSSLKSNLMGVYLRGSLAVGDFISQTSDINILAVTEKPVGDAEFAALASLHAQLAALPRSKAKE